MSELIVVLILAWLSMNLILIIAIHYINKEKRTRLICLDCKRSDHETCKQRESNYDYPSCDCQHKLDVVIEDNGNATRG